VLIFSFPFHVADATIASIRIRRAGEEASKQQEEMGKRAREVFEKKEQSIDHRSTDLFNFNLSHLADLRHAVRLEHILDLALDVAQAQRLAR
jgi:hypothetical protein